MWTSHSTAQPKKSFSPVTRWFGQKGTLKTIQSAHFAVQTEENSSGKIFSCLIMSDGFSFQLSPRHLGSNPQKADTRRGKHHSVGMGRSIHQNSCKSSKTLHLHLCGKKPRSEEKPPQNSVTLLEKRAAVFSHRCLEQTKVEADD